MTRLRTFLSSIGVLGRRRQHEQDLRDQMDAHLAEAAEDHLARGLSPAEARRRAAIELGGLERTKELCRDARGTRFVEDFLSDVRYAGRTLARRPGVTAAALLLLGLGIGANTAIFGFLEAVLVREVPVARPGELHFVMHRTSRGVRTASNYPFLERLRAERDAFDGVTAYTITTFKVEGVTSTEGVERTAGEFVAGNYHAVMGAPFALGRGFAADDDRPGPRSDVAVISSRYWTRKFQRSPTVLGQTITVDGRPLTIVGVTAPGFEGFTPGRPSEITVPLALKVRAAPEYLTMHDTWTSLSPVVRLRAGVSESRANEAVDRVFRQYLAEPDNAWYKVEAAFLGAAGRGSAELRDRYAASLTMLMAMVVVLLVIASASFANLQLSLAASRAKEVSIRLAIGAARGRLIRQLLTESLVLSLAGGALGLAIARVGSALVGATLESGRNPVVVNVELSLLVVGFTAAVAILTGVLFGLVPALRTTRVDLVAALAGRSRADRGRGGIRRALVVAQLALCLLLVVGAGLLVRTLSNLQGPAGAFNGRDLYLATLALDSGADDALPSGCIALVESLRANGQIGDAACSTSTPLDMTENRRGAAAGATGISGGVLANVVTPRFFQTFGLVLVKGRFLAETDLPAGQRAGVINETLARLGFGDADPLGRTFHFRAEPDRPFTIVGVVQDVPSAVREDVPPTVYTPLGQGGEIEGQLTVAVRARQPRAPVAELIRQAGRSLSSTLTLGSPMSFDEQIGGQFVRERTLALLSTWFGIVALAVACIGLYGVLSNEVAEERRDLGIRLALGATPARVLTGVLRRTAMLVALGLSIGLAASFITADVLSGLLFGLTPRDPLTFAVAATLMSVTAFVAGFLPARRAARVDPVTVLKSE